MSGGGGGRREGERGSERERERERERRYWNIMVHTVAIALTCTYILT